MDEYDRHEHFAEARRAFSDRRIVAGTGTSAHRGGLCTDLRFLVNHQSCEGTGHEARFALIRQLGQAGYHRHVCAERGLPPDDVAVMGTAANMNCAAHVVETHAELRVCAVVKRAWRAMRDAPVIRQPGTKRMQNGSVANPHAGTINTMLLINWPLTPGAMARAAVTMTEGKSPHCVTSPYPAAILTTSLRAPGPTSTVSRRRWTKREYQRPTRAIHAKLGELIGRAVRKATLESLRWQNGLEPSHTRSVFHALKRFGFGRDRFLRAMDVRLKEQERELMEKNLESVVYEPRVSAAAYAYAAVWDRVRYGTLSHAHWPIRCCGSRRQRWRPPWRRNPKRGRPVTPGFTQRKTPRWIWMRSPSDGV